MTALMYKEVEGRIRAYFESLVMKESLQYRLGMLGKQKKELELEIELEERGINTKNSKQQLEELNAQIQKLNSNLRLIEKEYSDMEFLINTLPERSRRIVFGHYHDKKPYRILGFDLFLSEGRVHQIRSKILRVFYDRLSSWKY